MCQCKYQLLGIHFVEMGLSFLKELGNHEATGYSKHLALRLNLCHLLNLVVDYYTIQCHNSHIPAVKKKVYFTNDLGSIVA